MTISGFGQTAGQSAWLTTSSGACGAHFVGSVLDLSLRVIEYMAALLGASAVSGHRPFVTQRTCKGRTGQSDFGSVGK